MTTLTTTTTTTTTPSTPTTELHRACIRHGLTGETTCSSCGAQTYDLSRPDERREVKDLRAMLLKKRRSWPILCGIVATFLPGFVEGIAHGAIVFRISLVPMALGIAVGVVAAKKLMPAPLSRLDAMLRTPLG